MNFYLKISYTTWSVGLLIMLQKTNTYLLKKCNFFMALNNSYCPSLYLQICLFFATYRCCDSCIMYNYDSRRIPTSGDNRWHLPPPQVFNHIYTRVIGKKMPFIKVVPVIHLNKGIIFDGSRKNGGSIGHTQHRGDAIFRSQFLRFIRGIWDWI